MGTYNLKTSIYATATLVALIALPILGTACEIPFAADGDAAEGTLEYGSYGWRPAPIARPKPPAPITASTPVTADKTVQKYHEKNEVTATILAILKRHNLCRPKSHCHAIRPNDWVIIENGDYGPIRRACERRYHDRLGACRFFRPYEREIWGYRHALDRWGGWDRRRAWNPRRWADENELRHRHLIDEDFFGDLDGEPVIVEPIIEPVIVEPVVEPVVELEPGHEEPSRDSDDDDEACDACDCDDDCRDDDHCTTDTCDISSHECVHEATKCDDYNMCTTDSCDETTGCIHVAINGCTPCTLADETVNCDDNNPCTADSCTFVDCATAGTCSHVPVPDGTNVPINELCFRSAKCEVGVVVKTPVDCGAGSACSPFAECDPAFGCLFATAQDGTPCPDDGFSSTIDECHNGVCVHLMTGPPDCHDHEDHCDHDGRDDHDRRALSHLDFTIWWRGLLRCGSRFRQ